MIVAKMRMEQFAHLIKTVLGLDQHIVVVGNLDHDVH